jgi:outer membrane protein OmpA-like peptidoglycan-associated protein
MADPDGAAAQDGTIPQAEPAQPEPQAAEVTDDEAAKAAARKAERQAERKAQRKAERQAERKAGQDAIANAPVAQTESDPAQTPPADGQVVQQPQGGDGVGNGATALSEEAARAERKARRKAERQQERARAKAEGNVLPSDTQEQADKSDELARQNRPAAATPGGEATVTTQTVAEGDVRKSSEDVAPGAAVAPKSGDDGISDLGKAVLFGLGALAVGSLLSNGNKVVANSGDRVIVETDNGYRVLKDDDALLRRPGSRVRTETYSDGSTRTLITQTDGSRIETIRSPDGRVLRRASVLPDGREIVLFDDTRDSRPVQVTQLPQPTGGGVAYDGSVSRDDLDRAMLATGTNPYGRSFSLTQIRSIDAVRRLVPEIAIENIRFQTGSAAIRPENARDLAALGGAIRDAIRRNPAEVFLIEGHTDAIGSAQMNLALSDRRAETVALALTEYFDVPPQNLVVQGYGEADLKVPTYAAEEANRRVAVRRITPLLN